jgi:hypothetical protein
VYVKWENDFFTSLIINDCLTKGIIPKGIIIQAKDYVGKILKFELKNTGIAIATASIFNDKI